MNARDNRSAQAPRQASDEARAQDQERPEAEARTSFEGIREVVATVHPNPDAPLRNGELLESARITCQTGGVAHNGAYCKQCTRFVNWLPTADRSKVTIRCLWSESDLVGDLMACISALVTVRPDTPMAEAAATAQRLEASYLLVEHMGRFEGVLYRQDMTEGDRVGERLVRPSWSLPPSATLREVVDVMLAHQTDFVPVVVEGTLLGVITRADLAEAGLEAVFGDQTE